jgi:hypothetical protein
MANTSPHHPAAPDGPELPSEGLPVSEGTEAGWRSPAADPAQNRRNPLVLIIGIGALLTALVAVTLVLVFTGSNERPMKVTLALFDSDATCTEGGSGGYDDIGPGMPITVKDQDGKVIGSESLPADGEYYAGAGCEWTVTVMVPDDAQQYAVEGGSRGAVTYSRAKLEENNWTAELSIGD